MKFIALSLGLILFTQGGAFAQANTLLRCEGFTSRFKGGIAITHSIELAGPLAKVDGTGYLLTTTTFQYALRGPLDKKGNTFTDPDKPYSIVIDRVNGSYFMEYPNTNGKIEDWSRPEDSGCKLVSQKF